VRNAAVNRIFSVDWNENPVEDTNNDYSWLIAPSPSQTPTQSIDTAPSYNFKELGNHVPSVESTSQKFVYPGLMKAFEQLILSSNIVDIDSLDSLEGGPATRMYWHLRLKVICNLKLLSHSLIL
jgi:hypothetical protein